MCGRYTMFSTDKDLVDLFDIDLLEGEHQPSYNEAPSQMVRTARQKQDEGRVLDLQQWGLRPFWAKENFKPLINARAETVTERPSFRSAASKRRCLIPTNGYYEWQKEEDGKKQPWFLSLAGKDGEPAPVGQEPIMAMAGLWERPGRDFPEGSPQTTAIVTREAADTLGFIHQRMPLFVPRSLWEAWLDPELTDPGEVQELVDAIPPAPLAPRMVSRAVGNVRNNYPGLILPEDPIPSQGELELP